MRTPALTQTLPEILSLTFTPTIPRHQGYISVAPSGKYFQDENGRGFLVIGQNDAVSWPGLCSLLSKPEETEAYIMDLREHGVTVSRIMMEYAQYPEHYLENPIGVYSPEIVHFWDTFIPLAEKHGLYLLLTPYDTFWQAKYWDSYPYSTIKGVKQSKHDWLTSRACIDAQKARWDFVIRRWGGSPNIFAWDIMNEIDLWWGNTAQEINDYITEMAPYVHDLELHYWGRAHMLTASSAAAVPSGELAEAIYNHPALDFANTHLYVGEGVKSPKDAVQAGPEIIRGVTESLKSMAAPRPYTDSETGPIDIWIDDLALDRQYHRNMSWAHLISGGAGSGMRWPYTEPHWIMPEFRDNLKSLACFAATIDWAYFDSRNIADKINLSKSGIVKTGCANEHLALMWLLRDTRQPDAPQLGRTVIEMDGVLNDGTYVVELWDTEHGYPFEELFPVKVSGGKITFKLPKLDVSLNDVAIIIREVSWD